MKSLGFILLLLPFSWPALNNTISITISGNGHTDQIALRFDSAGSTSYNSNLDAWKLFSSVAAVPQLYVRTAPQEPLSIYTMPLSALDTTVDLYLHIGNPGMYNLQAQIAGNFPSGTCIQLEDKASGQCYTFEQNSYPFQFNQACDSLSRFRIHFHAPPRSTALPASCFGTKNGSILIQAPGYSSWSGTLLDSSGKIVSNILSFRTTDTISKLAAGLYLINLDNTYHCSLSDSLRILQPAALSATFLLSDSLHISGTGEPVLFCNKSVNAISYKWSFGDSAISYQVSPQHIYYKPGLYTIQLTAANGLCKATNTRILDIHDFSTGTLNQEAIAGLQLLYNGRELELRNNGAEQPFETKISDLQGKTLLTFKGILTGTYKFSLPHAAASVYLVEVNTDQGLIRKKIIGNSGY
jgi:hypothetical protein